MRKSIFACTCILAAITVDLRIAFGQTPRNTGLLDQVTSGSEPYRDAVRRFLDRDDPKIVGGKKAPAGAFPWQVSLGVSWIADPYRAHFCGGSVYSESWIVTAAHCLENTAPKDVIVTAGTHLLGEGQIGTRRNVQRIIVKSNYDAKTSDNDIALIQLRDPMKLGQGIVAVPLLTSTTEGALLRDGAPLVVIGWGATKEQGRAVRDLRYADVPLVNRVQCDRPGSYDGLITNNMICAGLAVGGVDSCQGDSGGPLTVGTADKPQLAGVVSWGEGCARPNKPGVYTRVAHYVNWIADCVTKPEQCR